MRSPERRVARTVHTTGFLVQVSPSHLPQLISHLDSDHDIEVHLTDPPTGRLIAVLQSEDVATVVGRIEQLRQLPDVLLAEPIYTRCDEDLESEGQEAGTQ
jgi:nitrate reductase NapAB chaperone NapD